MVKNKILVDQKMYSPNHASSTRIMEVIAPLRTRSMIILGNCSENSCHLRKLLYIYIAGKETMDSTAVAIDNAAKVKYPP